MKSALQWIDLKGGVWLGLWSASVIAMSWFVVIADKGRDIPPGVVSAYGLALAAFAGAKIAGVIKGVTNDVDRPAGANGVPPGAPGFRPGD